MFSWSVAQNGELRRRKRERLVQWLYSGPSHFPSTGVINYMTLDSVSQTVIWRHGNLGNPIMQPRELYHPKQGNICQGPVKRLMMVGRLKNVDLICLFVTLASRSWFRVESLTLIHDDYVLFLMPVCEFLRFLFSALVFNSYSQLILQ